MSTEPVALEILSDDQKELLAVVTQNNLQPETAQNLQSSFAPLFSQARAIMDKSRAIAVTDVSQKLEIKLARTYRLELRAIRVASDKTRKELKEESLKKGKAIDGFHNILLHLVETEENRLDEQEKFAERKETERRAALKAERESLLSPYGVDTALFQLGEMTVETFDQLLSGTKLAHEAKLEAARKAEAERIAREAAELAERQRMQAENERLRKEAEEREAHEAKEKAEAAAVAATELTRRTTVHDARVKLIAPYLSLVPAPMEYADMSEERFIAVLEDRKQQVETAKKQAELEAKAKAKLEAAEAIATKERIAREKLEAEKRAAEEAQAAKVAAEAEALRKAAAAPDREKILTFAATIEALSVPALTADTLLAAKIAEQHGKYIKWLREKASAL